MLTIPSASGACIPIGSAGNSGHLIWSVRACEAANRDGCEVGDVGNT
jgi:hypothetical protein